MKTWSRALALALVGLLGWAASAAEEDWLTDFEQAKKQAAEKKLPILADFAGSDWCGWCIKLNDEVFSQQAFKDYAKNNLVLFLADFPRKKEVPAEIKSQNDKLFKNYSVQGFPTVLLLRADGSVIARTGYKPMGAAKYVDMLIDLLKTVPVQPGK